MVAIRRESSRAWHCCRVVGHRLAGTADTAADRIELIRPKTNRLSLDRECDLFPVAGNRHARVLSRACAESNERACSQRVRIDVELPDVPDVVDSALDVKGVAFRCPRELTDLGAALVSHRLWQSRDSRLTSIERNG